MKVMQKKTSPPSPTSPLWATPSPAEIPSWKPYSTTGFPLSPSPNFSAVGFFIKPGILWSQAHMEKQPLRRCWPFCSKKRAFTRAGLSEEFPSTCLQDATTEQAPSGY